MKPPTILHWKHYLLTILIMFVLSGCNDNWEYVNGEPIRMTPELRHKLDVQEEIYKLKIKKEALLRMSEETNDTP